MSPNQWGMLAGSLLAGLIVGVGVWIGARYIKSKALRGVVRVVGIIFALIAIANGVKQLEGLGHEIWVSQCTQACAAEPGTNEPDCHKICDCQFVKLTENRSMIELVKYMDKHTVNGEPDEELNEVMNEITNVCLVELGWGPVEGEAVPEESVLVYLKLSDENFGTEAERDTLNAFEEKLEALILEAGVGVLDGHESGTGEYTIFTYGPDADALYQAIEAELEAFPLAKGGHVMKTNLDENGKPVETRIDL